MEPFNDQIVMLIWDKPFNLDEVVRLRNLLLDIHRLSETARFLTEEINRVQRDRPARWEPEVENKNL